MFKINVRVRDRDKTRITTVENGHVTKRYIPCWEANGPGEEVRGWL